RFSGYSISSCSFDCDHYKMILDSWKGGIVYSNKDIMMSSSPSEGRTLHHKSIPGLESNLAVHK
ncbi:hypothetical protein HID58_054769, partial [Brassica napus]